MKCVCDECDFVIWSRFNPTSAVSPAKKGMGNLHTCLTRNCEGELRLYAQQLQASCLLEMVSV